MCISGSTAEELTKQTETLKVPKKTTDAIDQTPMRQSWEHVAAACIVCITAVSAQLLWTCSCPTVTVWWYGWLTAFSTGLGALPLLLFAKVDRWWTGASNAIAGGMMISTRWRCPLSHSFSLSVTLINHIIRAYILTLSLTHTLG